jgi:polysaccharide export outer membrane protein
MDKRNRPFSNFSVFTALLAGLLFQSCISHEKLVNFRDETPEDLLVAQYVPDVKKIIIQNDDILSITVSTFDSTAARVFNKSVSAAGDDGSFIGQGYLVDEDGYIEFPVLGKIKLLGMTRELAKDTIKNRLLTYLRDPVVDVRFLNLHVSVMGEVKQPSLYTFPDERFTILEALTMAGDMTDFADRSQILVIREHDKLREFGVVDLTSARAFESPYFYLTQNDVVYVKPLKEKGRVLQDPMSKILAITSIAVSLATVVVALSR